MKFVIFLVISSILLLAIGFRLGQSYIELSCVNYEGFVLRNDLYICKRVPPEMLKPKSQFNREA